MAVEEDHLADFKVLRVVQRVAVEALYEDALPVVPQRKSVGRTDHRHPLLHRVQC